MARKYDTSPLLPKEEKTCIQQIVITLLYYARSVVHIMLVALGSIAANQAKRNKTTSQAIKQLFHYCDSHTNSTIR